MTQNIPYMEERPEGLTLTDGKISYRGDFTKLLRRLRPENLNRELVVRAARGRQKTENATLVDATAGMGEDSLLLAAAGFRVTMIEYNPTICALLRDTLKRAAENEFLQPIVNRMTLLEGSCLEILPVLKEKPYAVYLDPMFPGREKSGNIKKKFQLLHGLEAPCSDGKELTEAALACDPVKILIKRPENAPYLGDIKPSYSLTGDSIRFDVLMLR